MSIDEKTAIVRAEALLADSPILACDFSSATLGRYPHPETKQLRAEWTVVFIPQDERARNMDPGEVWVIVDAQTGEARLQPLM